VVGEQMLGICAVDEVHRDPELTFVLAAVMHTDDVWVPQFGRQVGFAVEPFAKRGVARHVSR
jgi:hypothetical protein